MATDAIGGTQEQAVARPQPGLFQGRRGRALRENLTAYLFLFPAALIIFTFGIFPVFYAAYVSLYKWRIRQGEFRGLQNFVDSMGDVAYLFFGVITFAFLAIAISTGIMAFRNAREREIPVYFLGVSLIPGALLAAGGVDILLRCITFFTQDIAIERGYATVLGNIPRGAALVLAGIVLSTAISRWQHRVAAKSRHALLPNFTGSATISIALVGVALVLGRFTLVELQGSERYGAALERIGLMIVGVLLLAVAFFIWRWAMVQHSNMKTIGGILAATAFVGVGVFFSIFWPTISAESDPDFYQSLQVTIFFSLGTVPIQLAIAVTLAYLLFQDIRGKALFRVIFFIPYMAPSVAAAGIFQVLFSARQTSLANRIVDLLTPGTFEGFSWLKESTAAISAIGQSYGIETAVNWSFGPSLALAVIILYSIWTYVGYNTVIFLAGLGNIPSALYDAAEIDGAGRWALFRHVTLPLLSPITFLLSVLAVIGTFKAFNSIWVLRDAAALGTTDTASVFFFNEFFRGSRFGYATSMAIVLFVIILTLTIIQNQIAEKRVHYG